MKTVEKNVKCKLPKIRSVGFVYNGSGEMFDAFMRAMIHGYLDCSEQSIKSDEKIVSAELPKSA